MAMIALTRSRLGAVAGGESLLSSEDKDMPRDRRVAETQEGTKSRFTDVWAEP